MALILGNNCGFVTTAPTTDPEATDFSMNNFSNAMKQTITENINISEMGWYCGGQTDTPDFDIGIYDDSAGKPNKLLQSATGTITSTGWLKITGLDWDLTAGTYWVALEIDDSVSTDETMDWTATGGTNSLMNAFADQKLADTWVELAGLSGIIAVYALYTVTPTVNKNTGGGTRIDHDFKRFPELTNNQMTTLFFNSPHKQITEDFWARVTKVIDGDTIKVKWKERDFEFPIRIMNLAAPELNETGGKESQKWLESEILNKKVYIDLSPSRVEKWGRLLADVIYRGMRISELSVIKGHAVPWELRHLGRIE